MFSAESRTDGFGAQFELIINAICVVEENKLGKYFHIPIKSMEHNYDNDPNFLEKVENLMNLKKFYTPSTPEPLNITIIPSDNSLCIFNQNVDRYIRSETMKKLKQNFWENKTHPFKTHPNNIVAVHIRRPNSYDNRIDGANTELRYYIDKMKVVYEKYPNSIFYIYSQSSGSSTSSNGNSNTGPPSSTSSNGNANDDFSQIPSYMNVVFRIDAPLEETFTELVDADVLIMSRSSFSYAAALLSDGEIYYNPFWVPPASFWL